MKTAELKNQMELSLEIRGNFRGRRSKRPTRRAGWWFTQMRQVVDRLALDHDRLVMVAVRFQPRAAGFHLGHLAIEDLAPLVRGQRSLVAAGVAVVSHRPATIPIGCRQPAAIADRSAGKSSGRSATQTW